MTMEEQEQLDQVDEHEQEGEEVKLDNVELDNVELENVELEPEVEVAEPVEEAQAVPTPTIHIDTPPPLPAKQLPPTPALASASKESFSDVALSRSGTPAVQQPQPQRAGPSRPSSTRPPSTSYHPSHPHSRRSSTATTLSLSNNTQNGPQLSSIIITPPLQQIAASKEAKRSPAFLAAANKALELCAEGNAAYLHPRLIFEPLRMACETRQEKLVVTSLDLMSKLISHSFFYEPYGPPSGQPPLADLIAHTIAITYSEASPPAVALQVVKALLALVLSTKILVHQSSLLKALRTVYNVFLLSTDATNQMVAQGGLTQIVHHVFGRVRRPQRGSISERVGTPVEEEKMTLQTFETPNPNDNLPADAVKVPTDTVPIPVPIVGGEALEAAAENEEGSLDAAGRPIPTEELFVKDAFLVFRALCKLSKTPMPVESERDLKSIDMRSKLLSLHLVLTILKSHADMFVNPAVAIPSSTSAASTQFLQATKQYLCLSLSRNAVSPVIQVFELSVEIFWQVLKTMRAQMKKEIEVLLNEIFLPILEMRHSTVRQKSLLLSVFIRLCQDPQALVEIYINYDCDRAALENIYERLMNIISKIGQTHFAPPGKEELQHAKPSTSAGGPSIPPSLSTSAMGEGSALYAGLSPEIKLRRQSLECLVEALKSLVVWSSAGRNTADENAARASEEGPRPYSTGPAGGSSVALDEPAPTPVPDDVDRFESAKQRKTNLLEGVKKFNFKPKRGVQYLIEHGFIKSAAPGDIARFLLNADGLSKAMIGEYLGEGDEANIATMHAFVDMLDFTDLKFTEAVRMFLQSFRLPGEAQKIDRFVLKFAERYIAGNPTTEFANADTAYILAFSVIMLNTDAHNKNMKNRRMSKAEFVKNNRGINDGKDLPEEFLGEIYDEIQNNEIKMKDEVELPTAQAPAGLAGTLANVGRDLQREAYVVQSEGMASKTEALFKSMVRQQRRGPRPTDQFYSASRLEHVRFMFEVAWMPFLAGISAPLQESDELEVVLLCLEGFKAAIKIVCLFDLELERNAFVTTLAKFTFLNNLGEMKTKNVEAIKALLDIAVTDGNNLKGSWKDVLTCVSQLERMQLISNGMDVPDARKSRGPADEVAEEGRSSQVTVAADMVFSTSKYLSGPAIIDFVKALSDVSWEEIQSSGKSNHPRLFCLQKLVEISYYNMARIRLEWSNIWTTLGEHFNQVCCHNNPNVSFFALDALRQLAMNFLEKDELSHFRFQKEFLKPFEYTMVNNQNSDAREMVLQCLQQMLQARVQNLRSGWRTMFAVFTAASKVLTERVANHAFELVSLIHREHFALVVRYGAFTDLVVCITDFSKVNKFQKISLQAIEMLRGMVPKMLECADCRSGDAVDDKFWFPVLFSFYDIIMTGEDLEVRRLALDTLFDTLKTHGAGFSVEFWDSVCKQVLFPIFAVLHSSADVSRFSTQEDMSVWLSTTMITALRNLVALYTHYFDTLERFLDGLLELLCACICQENDTLARIGTACFQQLLENNVHKLSPAKWEQVVSAFVKLFQTTTAHQLFDEALRVETDAPAVQEEAPTLVAPAPLTPVDINGTQPKTYNGAVTAAERRRAFKQIIVKCVLQLLLIETTHELLQNDDVYGTIPAEHLLRFMGVLDDSYQFARKFNANKELRVALWKVGFMKQLPNLLKQESSSAATLVNVLLRMYQDPRAEHRATRAGVLDRLIPLGSDIIRDFNAIDVETQPRNVAAWTPVVAEVLQGTVGFEDEAFTSHLSTLYPLVTDILGREMQPEMRQSVRAFFQKVGRVQGLISVAKE